MTQNSTFYRIHTMYRLLFLSLFVIANTACSNSKKHTGKAEHLESNRIESPKTTVYADVNFDGDYKIIELEKENIPEPKQGNSLWIKDFFSHFSYPVSAKENGVQGVVILEASFDTFGRLVNTRIKQTLTAECDQVALESFLIATTQGYQPLAIKGIPVNYKIDLQIRFSLE